MDKSKSIEDFVNLSTVVTGFSHFDLYGTDRVYAYYEAIAKVVGDILNELLETFSNLYARLQDNASALDKWMRTKIFGSEKFRPIDI